MEFLRRIPVPSHHVEGTATRGLFLPFCGRTPLAPKVPEVLLHGGPEVQVPVLLSEGGRWPAGLRTSNSNQPIWAYNMGVSFFYRAPPRKKGGYSFGVSP